MNELNEVRLTDQAKEGDACPAADGGTLILQKC
jgi:hypothetical protein